METRQRILDAARRLFHEQGYHATGITTILREAEVNSGSLYHFFASKEAVLIGVLEWYVDLLQPEVMGPAEAAADDPVERVFALLAGYRGMMLHTGCRMGCPIGNLALEVGDDVPEARRLIDLNFGNWARRVESWLVEAGDRLPASCDRARLAKFVLTVMEGGLMQCRAAGSLAPYDESVAELRAYLDVLTHRARAERDASSKSIARPSGGAKRKGGPG